MFGYIDESGTPGVCQGKLDDYLVAGLVIVENRTALEQLNTQMDALRSKTHLPDDFEFHFAYNINPAKTNFIHLLQTADFEFIIIAIKKNNKKQFGSYVNLADYLAREITKNFPNISIEMDTNPILYKELRKNFKSQNVKIKIKQVRSRGQNLIQAADYVTALATRSLKKPTKCAKDYAKISAKCNAFIVVK